MHGRRPEDLQVVKNKSIANIKTFKGTFFANETMVLFMTEKALTSPSIVKGSLNGMDELLI